MLYTRMYCLNGFFNTRGSVSHIFVMNRKREWRVMKMKFRYVIGYIELLSYRARGFGMLKEKKIKASDVGSNDGMM